MHAGHEQFSFSFHSGHRVTTIAATDTPTKPVGCGFIDFLTFNTRAPIEWKSMRNAKHSAHAIECYHGHSCRVSAGKTTLREYFHEKGPTTKNTTANTHASDHNNSFIVRKCADISRTEVYCSVGSSHHRQMCVVSE